MSQPGVGQFTNIMDEDGAVCAIGIRNNRESTCARADREKENWAACAGLLDPVDAVQGHKVGANRPA